MTNTGKGLGIFKDGHVHDKREFSRKNEEIGGGLGNGLAGEGRFKFDFNGYFTDFYQVRIENEYFKRVNLENKKLEKQAYIIQEESHNLTSQSNDRTSYLKDTGNKYQFSTWANRNSSNNSQDL